jgi:hypothetical protein
VVGISTVLLLAGGTFFTSMSLKTANAQASTLGEPILVEKGKITSQSQLGPNRTIILLFRVTLHYLPAVCLNQLIP